MVLALGQPLRVAGAVGALPVEIGRRFVAPRRRERQSGGHPASRPGFDRRARVERQARQACRAPSRRPTRPDWLPSPMSRRAGGRRARNGDCPSWRRPARSGVVFARRGPSRRSAHRRWRSGLADTPACRCPTRRTARSPVVALHWSHLPAPAPAGRSARADRDRTARRRASRRGCRPDGRSRQVAAVVAAALHDLARAGRQRLHDEVRVLVAGAGAAVARVEHGLAAGQHLRPPLGRFALGERRQRLGLPAGRRHAQQVRAGVPLG